MEKLYAKIFYWLFLQKTTPEMYDIVDYGTGLRKPTKEGKMFYEVYHYLNNS